MPAVEAVFLGELPDARFDESIPNVFRDPDALFETCFVGMKFDAVNLRWGFLFDLRTSLNFDATAGDTGLLVLDGVTRLTWAADPFPSPRRAWNLMDSRVGDVFPLVAIEFGFHENEFLAVEAVNGAFCVLTVGGLGKVQPDFGESSDEEVVRGMPSWEKDCTVHSVTTSGNAR